MIKKIFRKILGPLSDKGILHLAKLGHKFRLFQQYQPITHMSIALDMLTSRNTERLRVISDVLDGSVMNGIDIGCNNGYFVYELANKGHNMMGIEGDPVTYRILNAAKNISGLNNVHTANYYINPDNVIFIPSVDFIICLSVFHHWCKNFGDEKALLMLNVILQKGGRYVFFEPPYAIDSSEKYAKVLPDRNSEEPERWWIEYLNTNGYSDVKVIYRSGRTVFMIQNNG